MTITLQTVNELIASLDSAGELSIKETKVMALAKAFKQLAAENVALKGMHHYSGLSPKHSKDAMLDMKRPFIDELIYSAEFYSVCGHISASLNRAISAVHGDYSWLPETPATDRIVAGFKADGVAEREKTITFTAAKKRTQDGVALIAIGKPYKIHNDDMIGEFFIGERGRYGVITMDRLNYFATSDEYAWAFSLREEAGK